MLLVSLAFSADYKPFTFDNIPDNDSAQQVEWDILMKYKVFGAYTFSITNNSVRLTDKSGWIGTSKGDLILAQNGGDTLGGPIIVGGDLTFKNGPDVFTTGPLNVYGNVKAKNKHALGTSAYLTKLFSKSVAKHRCDYKEQQKGDRTVKKEEDFTTFGYKRPKK